MQANEYQKLAMLTAKEFSQQIYTNDAQQAIHGVLGLVGESGEVADLVKKTIFHGHFLDINHFKDELGDVFWYVAFLASIYGITLEDIMQTNIDKLNKRYPNGFSSSASINRVDVTPNPFYVKVVDNGI